MALLGMFVSVLYSEGENSEGGPYATEEMAYKDDENSARSILVVGIQALECILLPILIQHRQVGDLLEVFFGRRIVVDLDVAFEVSRRVLHSHVVE